MIIRALLQFYLYYGDEFTIECPTGSGRRMTLFEIAKEISDRLARIFLVDSDGRRPVLGATQKFQEDPHWRDCLLFYEYFHGDTGAGLGASHQTGWTGLVAKQIEFFRTVTAKELLAGGRASAYGTASQSPVMGVSTLKRGAFAFGGEEAITSVGDERA
jgi:hypothetical protein